MKIYSNTSIFKLGYQYWPLCWYSSRCINKNKYEYMLTLSFISKSRHLANQQYLSRCHLSWWRHQIEAFSELLALCAGNWPVTGEFPSQRASDAELWCFFDVGHNKQLNQPSSCWWFEAPCRPLWRHFNVNWEQMCSSVTLLIWKSFMYHDMKELWCDNMRIEPDFVPSFFSCLLFRSVHIILSCVSTSQFYWPLYQIRGDIMVNAR